jgi:glycerophosphoryl diester phosphodiesterase
MISAHRGGAQVAASGTWAAYRSALAQGADYLEFDVRVASDGTLVAYHETRVRRARPVAAMSYPELCRSAGYEVPTTAALLRLLANRAGAHIDLKEPDAAPAIMTQALEVPAPASVIVTTRDRAAATAVKRADPAVAVGLTIGGDLPDAVRYALRRERHRGRLSRAAAWAVEVAAARADCAAVQQRLARSGVLTECRGRGLRTMVWTVNGDEDLRFWLASREVDVLVTDQPGRAVELRQASD